MSQRYYLSKVIGTGSSHDPYRVKVADAVGAASVMAFVPVDPNTGIPTLTSVLCVAEAPGLTHAALAADKDNAQLPDNGLLAVKLASLASTVRNKMNSDASIAGFNVNFTADSFKDWVNGIGVQCDPAFQVDTFTVT